MSLGLLLCGVLMMSAYALKAQTMATYAFSETTGLPTDMTGSSQIFGAGIDDAISSLYPIGFTFKMNNTNFTQFCASSNGYIGLGGTANSYLTQDFTTSTYGVPVICGLGRDAHTGSDGSVTYITTGVAGSRILTVNFQIRDYPGSGQPTNTRYQIRLYEGSNRIELWYGPVVTSGGVFGAKNAPGDFAAIFPGPPATVSYVSNYTGAPPSNVNKVYDFDLCTIVNAGNIAQGGTATMQNFDSLMRNVSVQRGNSGTFTPFTITPTGCAPSANMTYSISGANASDYSISPTSASVTPGGNSTPTITFNPTGVGVRNAVLTVTGPNSYLRTYYLAATAAPRIIYTGNVPQGGTASMNNGDTLLGSVSILRGTSVNLTPFMLTNINTNGAATPAAITYTIKGTSGGQYAISPPSTSLGATQSNTPTITFNATGVGFVIDTLTVVADGQTRVFRLSAYSEAPGLDMRIAGVQVDSTSQIFRNAYSCMGGSYVTIPVQITNSGGGTLVVNNIQVYKTDTMYRQGNPRYALIRDPKTEGGYMMLPDYVMTVNPPVLPTTAPANAVGFPLHLTRGQSQTVYLSFNAWRRDKRFGRIVVTSNGQNVINPNPANGALTQGLLWFDVYGRGIGGELSAPGTTNPPGALQFPTIRIDSSVTAYYMLYNSGECDLRVSSKDLRLISGDVDEFEIVDKPHAYIDATTGDDIIPVGKMDSVGVRFMPKQQGSRRATMHVQTNDSMEVVDGVTERGLYRVDVYGEGKTGLYMTSFDFGQALIKGTGPDVRAGSVRLENTRITPITITKLELDGTNKGDFATGAPTWPTLPVTLTPGQILELALTFSPADTPTGGRSAFVRATTSDNDVIIGQLTGVAGTRSIEVTPTVINFGQVPQGKHARKSFMIRNTGTMPLTLKQPDLSQPGTDFAITPLSRLQFAPTQAEVVELTFTPSAPGPIQGVSININSDATNGQQVVTVNGSAYTKGPGNADPSVTAGGHGGIDNIDIVSNGLEEFSISGVAGVRDANGMALMQSVPNPARDVVQISYILPTRGDVNLALYDDQGRLVRVLDAGMREAGESNVRIDVGGLANGLYHYRLVANGSSLSRTLTIVR
ncbi:MAG: choice-of-anchor D domain-containing protein [Bacteroidetes bacterium]|nr:choice-of-anchor D domain-containing protein [Bacteroidota bacterium]